MRLWLSVDRPKEQDYAGFVESEPREASACHAAIVRRVLERKGVAGRSAHDRERGKRIVIRVNAVTLLTARRIIAYDDRNHPVLCLGLFIGSGYVR